MRNAVRLLNNKIGIKLSFKKYFKIDPLKSFTQLPILWFVVIFLFSIATIITLIIIFNSDLALSFDYNGFNSFVDIFKVPISILAIIITFIAILATAHRSIQTREQIIITQRQNTFSNYFKHIEEFEKYINSSILEKSVYYSNLRLTHKYLFPNSYDGDYSINKDILCKIESEYSNFIKLLHQFEQSEEKSVFDIFYEIYSKIDEVFLLINIKIGRSGRQLVVKAKKIVVPEFSLSNAILEIKKSAVLLISILSFDHFVKIPDSLKTISELNLLTIPDIQIDRCENVQPFSVFHNNIK